MKGKYKREMGMFLLTAILCVAAPLQIRAETAAYSLAEHLSAAGAEVVMGAEIQGRNPVFHAEITEDLETQITIPDQAQLLTLLDGIQLALCNTADEIPAETYFDLEGYFIRSYQTDGTLRSVFLTKAGYLLNAEYKSVLNIRPSIHIIPDTVYKVADGQENLTALSELFASARTIADARAAGEYTELRIKQNLNTQIVMDKSMVGAYFSQAIVFPASIETDFLRAVTRREFCEIVFLMLAKADHLPPYQYNAAFKDVEKNLAIETLNGAGIVQGRYAGYFMPDATISCEEAAVILDRTSKYLRVDMPDYRTAELFADDTDISDWARESIYRMYLLGVIDERKDGLLHPKIEISVEFARIYVRSIADYWDCDF